MSPAVHSLPAQAQRRAHWKRRGVLYERTKRKRPPRAYGPRWRRLRRLVLAREPLCRECAPRGLVVEATEVDHIIPLRAGGTDDDANLQPLCKRCHSRKGAREGRWGGAPRPRGPA